MSRINPEQQWSGDSASPEHAQGYLLSGEALQNVTLDQLRKKLGELALEPEIKIVPIFDLNAIQAVAEMHEKEVDQILIHYEELRSFAVSHGYSDARATRAWHTAMATELASRSHLEHSPHSDPYPHLEVRQKATLLDFRTVHKRLVVSQLRPDAWINGTKGFINFMCHAVNKIVEPDEVLPFGLPKDS